MLDLQTRAAEAYPEVHTHLHLCISYTKCNCISASLIASRLYLCIIDSKSTVFTQYIK